MFDMPNVHRSADVRKYLIALFVVLAVVTVSFAMATSDGSDAAPTYTPDFTVNEYYKEMLQEMSDNGDKAATIALDVYNAYFTVVPNGNSAKDNNLTVTTSLNPNSLSEEQLTNAMLYAKMAFDMDHPEYFWFQKFTPDHTSISYSPSQITMRVFGISDYNGAPVISTIAQAMEASKYMEDTVKGWIADCTTTYDKIVAINEGICLMVAYDHGATDTDDPYNKTIDGKINCRNIWSAMSADGDRLIVCEGYAKTFKYACDIAGIECVEIVGNAYQGGAPGGHAWNYVKMDNGQWYMVDSTWNDGSTGFDTDYLLVGSKTMVGSRTAGASHVNSVEEFTNPAYGIPVAFANVPVISDSKYTPGSFTVTFKNFDGTVIDGYTITEVDFDSLIDRPANPVFTGEVTPAPIFDDWYNGNTKWDFGSDTVTRNLTLTAKSTKAYTYTFTYKQLDNTLTDSVTTYSLFDKLIYPMCPMTIKTKEYEYTFIGWDNHPDEVAEHNGLKYTAQYVQKEVKYTVKFLDIDGKVISSQEYSYNQALTEPSTDYASVVWDKVIPANVQDNLVFTVVYGMKVDSAGDCSISAKNDIKISDSDIATARGHNLKVEFSGYSITFDGTATDALVTGQTLSMKKINANTLGAAKSAARNGAAYEIDFGDNNNVFTSGKAKVCIDFVLGYGQKESDITVSFVNDGVVTPIESTYENGQIVFETNHFSTYAYSLPDSVATLINLAKENMVIVFILLFAIIGMALAYKFS